GGGGLEESLKAFEAGVKLSKACHKQLVEAQKRVEILVQDENGKENKEPFTA
ncbi:MAG: exodeoxyribonuclease VII small subunit, partial [SAR324 cluster bacterium]|nr:exodeoxyribonuclease VII small subunit [SAR324 cluster bacterium]